MHFTHHDRPFGGFGSDSESREKMEPKTICTKQLFPTTICFLRWMLECLIFWGGWQSNPEFLFCAHGFGVQFLARLGIPNRDRASICCCVCNAHHFPPLKRNARANIYYNNVVVYERTLVRELRASVHVRELRASVHACELRASVCM